MGSRNQLLGPLTWFPQLKKWNRFQKSITWLLDVISTTLLSLLCFLSLSKKLRSFLSILNNSTCFQGRVLKLFYWSIWIRNYPEPESSWTILVNFGPSKTIGNILDHPKPTWTIWDHLETSGPTWTIWKTSTTFWSKISSFYVCISCHIWWKEEETRAAS